MYYIKVMGYNVGEAEVQIGHCRFRVVLYVNRGDMSNPGYMQLGVF